MVSGRFLVSENWRAFCEFFPHVNTCGAGEIILGRKPERDHCRSGAVLVLNDDWLLGDSNGSYFWNSDNLAVVLGNKLMVEGPINTGVKYADKRVGHLE